MMVLKSFSPSQLQSFAASLTPPVGSSWDQHQQGLWKMDLWSSSALKIKEQTSPEVGEGMRLARYAEEKKNKLRGGWQLMQHKTALQSYMWPLRQWRHKSTPNQLGPTWLWNHSPTVLCFLILAPLHHKSSKILVIQKTLCKERQSLIREKSPPIPDMPHFFPTFFSWVILLSIKTSSQSERSKIPDHFLRVDAHFLHLVSSTIIFLVNSTFSSA